MSAIKELPGPTPAGGEKAILYFLDDNRNSTEEEHATAVEIVELDKNGKVLQRTYARIEEKKKNQED